MPDTSKLLEARGQSLSADFDGDPLLAQFHHDVVLEDLPSKSFSGGIVGMVAQAIKFILQVLSTMILARMLTPQDFGLVAMVMAITGFIATFKDGGLSAATVQRLTITHAQVSLLFWLNCALSLALALTVAALAPAIAWFYAEPRLLMITVALALSFLFTGLAVQHEALMRRQMRFKDLAVIEIIAVTAATTVGIALAWLGFGYWALVGLNVALTVINVILVWKACHWRPGRPARNVGARSMVHFGRDLTTFLVLNYFTRNFDNILIGRAIGSAALGIYSKAYSLLALPMNQISVPIGDVVVPALSRMQDKPGDYNVFFLRGLRTLVLLAVPIVAFCFFEAKDVVLVLLGPKWLPVTRVFELLAPAALGGAIAWAPGWLCISLGKPNKKVHYAVVSAPVCVAGFLVGVHWGIEGVAVSFSVTYTAVLCAFIWYSAKDSPVHIGDIVHCICDALLPALIAGFIVWGVRHYLLAQVSAVVALIICGTVFGVCYIGAAISFRENRDLSSLGVGALRDLRGGNSA